MRLICSAIPLPPFKPGFPTQTIIYLFERGSNIERGLRPLSLTHYLLSTGVQ